MKNVIKFYRQHREVINYLITGGITTLVSLAVYYLCVATFLDPTVTFSLQVANILSWIAGVAVAYITNRTFVFHSRSPKIFKEICSFVVARIFTLLLDICIMQVAVINLGINDKIAKIVSQVLVIVLNYILSKLFVFKTKTKSSPRTEELASLAEPVDLDETN